MITLHDRMSRGRTNAGWLDSRHSFSFGSYYDPTQLGFRSLRVINEDRVIPGAGFPSHSHKDMEILSYVLEGGLRHKDSLGNGSVITPGEVQRMSAGSGITHIEYNASAYQAVHFLQIWVIPNERGIPPGYEQKTLSREGKRGMLELAAGPKGSGAPVSIQQDARMYVARLDASSELSHELAAGRGAWLQVTRGAVALNGAEMKEGDGAAIEDEALFAIAGISEAEILLFDLA